MRGQNRPTFLSLFETLIKTSTVEYAAVARDSGVEPGDDAEMVAVFFIVGENNTSDNLP
jgi:hypothetical protein